MYLVISQRCISNGLEDTEFNYIIIVIVLSGNGSTIGKTETSTTITNDNVQETSALLLVTCWDHIMIVRYCLPSGSLFQPKHSPSWCRNDC